MKDQGNADIKSTGFGLGLSASDITGAFRCAVQSEIADNREQRLPIAKYDMDKKKAYLESADGTREYTQR